MGILYKHTLFLFIIGLTFSSCFKEDEPIDPNMIPKDTLVYQIDKTIYEYQTFFSLHEAKIVSTNQIDAWDLAFETGEKEWHIRVNSANNLGMYNTKATNMNDITDINGLGSWQYDSSAGLTDSTAVGEWLTFGLDTLSKMEVYLIGKFDGISYIPFRKLKFISWSEKNYTLISSNIDGSDIQTSVILKNELYNLMYLSFKNPQKTIVIEPPKDQWDLLFTQYSTVLFTDEGLPTPYNVRGVLQNANGVETADLNNVNFFEIGANYIPALNFSKRWDAIGYAWKDVKVSESTNSASYKVDPNRNYIVKGIDGVYYKLKFVSFFNEEGVRGYPKFKLRVIE